MPSTPLYVLPLFEEYIRNYASEFRIGGISCCRIMGTRSRWKLAGDLVCLYGLRGFLRLLARQAVSSVLARFPRARGSRRYYSVAQLCRAYGIPCVRIGNPNLDGFVRALRERSPDLIISVACPFILKKSLLECPPMGCINLHNAPLPHYRGMMPTFWQMFNGEEAVGLTIHYMTEEIDGDSVLFQDRM